MKKLSALILTLILVTCFSTAPANAGAARRHTIEGFVLGTGVALLGTAIVHSMNREAQPAWEKQRSPHYPRHKRYKSGRHHRQYAGAPRGHWETREIWIADKYKKRWNPGHYNRRGNWVNGRYKKFLVQQGHWQTQRVWVGTKYTHR